MEGGFSNIENGESNFCFLLSDDGVGIKGLFDEGVTVGGGEEA